MRMKKLYLLNPLDNAHAEHTIKKSSGLSALSFFLLSIFF